MACKNINRIFEYLDILFNVPRTYILRHVNDDSDIISRADSEKRIFWLFFILGFALNLGGSFVIYIFMIFEDEPTNYEIIETESGKELFGSPVLQELVLILGDGTSLFLYMNKSLHLKITKTHKFNYDPFGFFAYYQNDHIQTLIGNQMKPNYIHDLNFNSKKIFGSDLPSGFAEDLTGVKFGHWFWFIGGEKNPFGVGDMTRNPNSYLWSMNKKRWFKGPQYYSKTKYVFHYTCGIPLNSSAILFVGLKNTNNFDTTINPNKYVCIYNFDTKTWVEQDSLIFRVNDLQLMKYDYNPACVIEQNKDSSRYIPKNLKEPEGA